MGGTDGVIVRPVLGLVLATERDAERERNRADAPPTNAQLADRLMASLTLMPGDLTPRATRVVVDRDVLTECVGRLLGSVVVGPLPIERITTVSTDTAMPTNGESNR